MKKTNQLFTAILLIVGAAVFILLSCDKSGKEDEPIQIIHGGGPPNIPQTLCNCGNKPGGICPGFKNCVESFMGSGSSRSFIINWTSCTGCGGTLPPATTGLACYTGNCNELFLQFNNLPSCMQSCYGSGVYCATATNISCNKGSYSIDYQSGDNTQHIVITGDPHISVECNIPGQPYLKCEGDLTWQ